MSTIQEDIDRVVPVGRLHGALTTDDLAELVPLDRRTPDEIARIVAALEDAGVEVELAPQLLRPRGAAPAPAAGTVAISDETAPARATSSATAMSAIVSAPAAPPPRSSTRWLLVTAIAVLVVICAIVAAGLALG